MQKWKKLGKIIKNYLIYTLFCKKLSYVKFFAKTTLYNTIVCKTLPYNGLWPLTANFNRWPACDTHVML